MAAKRFTKGLNGLLFALGVATAAAGPASAAEKVIYQLGWVPGGSNAIEYLAVTGGFFAAEGLDVQILSGNGASDTLTKVAAGRADIGAIGIEALMAAEAEGPVPAKAIFSLYSKKPDSINTPVDSGITTIADLAGKRVGTAAYSSSNVVWPVFAAQNGLDPAKITVTQVDAAALAPLMASGQVDAIINWITTAPLDAAVLEAAGKKMRVIPWSDYGYEGYSQSFVAGEKFLKDRPEVARAFLRAIVKATDAAIADPMKAAEAIHQLVPEIDAAIAAQEFTASIPLIRNDVTAADGYGNFTPARLTTTWTWVAQSRNLKLDAIAPERVVDTSYQR